MIDRISKLKDEEVTNILSYAGYVLLSHEIIKNMIVEPIKLFYKGITFNGGPFNTYEEDVLTRHKNIFEASLLYLKDFMGAIDSSDIETIQSLRKHRNDLAHNLPDRLAVEQIKNNLKLLDKSKKVIFKLSNYRAYMEVGQEPKLKNIDWKTVKGNEYLLLETIIEKIKNLNFIER